MASNASNVYRIFFSVLEFPYALYLDDTDKDMIFRSRGMREAEELLRQRAKDVEAKVEEFTDFVPYNFCPTQGMLAYRKL